MAYIYYDSGAHVGAGTVRESNNNTTVSSHGVYINNSRGVANEYRNGDSNGRKVMTTDDFMKYYNSRRPNANVQSADTEVRRVQNPTADKFENSASNQKKSTTTGRVIKISSDVPVNKTQNTANGINQVRPAPMPASSRRIATSASTAVVTDTGAKQKSTVAANRPNCSYSAQSGTVKIPGGHTEKSNIDKKIGISKIGDCGDGSTIEYSIRPTVEYSLGDTMKFTGSVTAKNVNSNNKATNVTPAESGRKLTISEKFKKTFAVWFNKSEPETDSYARSTVKPKYFSFSVVVTVFTVAVSLLLIVGSSVMVGNETSELGKAKDEVNALAATVEQKQALLDEKNDPALIEKIATEELGMIKRDYISTKYLKLEDSDETVEYPEENKGSITMSALLSAIDSLFH